MAERLETQPAMQVARVRFPVPARPTFSVEKWLFSVTLRQGARSRALQLSTLLMIICTVKQIVRWMRREQVNRFNWVLLLYIRQLACWPLQEKNKCE
jgi:hypothetical protein